MQSVDVKMALQNYKEFHKGVKDIENNIEALNAIRFKAGGSIAKIPENTKPREVIIIENLEKLDKLKLSLSLHYYLSKLADDFIDALNGDFKEMVIDKYVRNMNAYELEQKYCYSYRQIQNIIKKLIDRYIEIT